MYDEQPSVGLQTDFFTNAFYVYEEESQSYVRVFAYDAGVTTYYTVDYTLIEPDVNGKFPDYDPDETYYIQSAGITSLEEYFCRLKDLWNINYKYIMLPLDEPPMEIDANKRTITIPSNLKTAGLSVEGDQLAETLFFRVARYFDYMDLSTCDIAVQWILPNGDEYATLIEMIDVESDPGYLIFACPLTAEITQVAGSVELAVRFFKMGGSNTIDYSLNTLPVKANIGAALKIKNPTAVTESAVQNLFNSAIENSDLAVGTPAPAPVFMVPLSAIDKEENRLTNIIYLQDTKDNKLYVEADANPKGIITYTWYHTPITGGVGQIIGDAATKEIDLTSLEGSITGTYQVKAINRINNKTARAWSGTVILPAPEAPIIEDMTDTVIENTTNGVTITVNETTDQTKATYKYEWQRKAPDTTNYVAISDANDTQNSYIAKVAGDYKVKITTSLNGDSKDNESNSIRVTNLPAAITFGTDDAKEATGEETKIANIVYTALDSYTPAVNEPDMVGKDARFISDHIYYTWIQDVKKDGKYNGVLKADGSIDFDDAKILVPGYTITEDGTYTYNTSPTLDFNLYGSTIATLGAGVGVRCVATNVLNGKETNTESLVYVFA